MSCTQSALHVDNVSIEPTAHMPISVQQYVSIVAGFIDICQYAAYVEGSLGILLILYL